MKAATRHKRAILRDRRRYGPDDYGPPGWLGPMTGFELYLMAHQQAMETTRLLRTMASQADPEYHPIFARAIDDIWAAIPRPPVRSVSHHLVATFQHPPRLAARILEGANFVYRIFEGETPEGATAPGPLSSHGGSPASAPGRGATDTAASDLGHEPTGTG